MRQSLMMTIPNGWTPWTACLTMRGARSTTLHPMAPESRSVLLGHAVCAQHILSRETGLLLWRERLPCFNAA